MHHLASGLGIHCKYRCFLTAHIQKGVSKKLDERKLHSFGGMSRQHEHDLEVDISMLVKCLTVDYLASEILLSLDDDDVD